MQITGWLKGLAVVVAAVGTAATAGMADLAAGGERRWKAVIVCVVAGVVALAGYASTDAGRAAVKAEAPAAAQAAVTTAVALLATPAGVDAVVRAQDAVAGGPVAGGER